MNIGIIGAGNIGSALTHRLRAAGHDIAVANSRGPASLEAFAKETGAEAVTVEDAARARDLVVITIQMKHIEDLPHGLFSSASPDLIVIDTNNYYPRHRDGRIAGIEDPNIPESRWVEQQLGHPVVKAFNNIFAASLKDNGKPAGTPGRIALPIAGDDPKPKQTVMQLVDQIGFDPVDAGTIDESWRQQPGSPVYTKDFDRAGVLRALGQASPERTSDWRATPNSPGTYEQPK